MKIQNFREKIVLAQQWKMHQHNMRNAVHLLPIVIFFDFLNEKQANEMIFFRAFSYEHFVCNQNKVYLSIILEISFMHFIRYNLSFGLHINYDKIVLNPFNKGKFYFFIWKDKMNCNHKYLAYHDAIIDAVKLSNVHVRILYTFTMQSMQMNKWRAILKSKRLFSPWLHIQTQKRIA